jgi:hypothetical protein
MSAVNPLITSYGIHGRKGEVLLFCSVPDTTQNNLVILFVLVVVNVGIQVLLHIHHSRFIPEGVAEVFQIFLQDVHVLPKLFSYE